MLVASHDAALLRSVGIDLLQLLWSHEFSAELAQDSDDTRALEEKHRADHHCWIVIAKQDSMVKIKSNGRSDVEIPTTQLISWLRADLRERESRDANVPRARLARHTSQPDANMSETEQEVRVLMSGTKSKKSNRRNIVEQAQARASALLHSFKDGPIAAVETSDHVIDLIRPTRLSDAESWRKVTHSVATTERRYIGEIHELLSELARDHQESRNAFLYNFKTGTCIPYDLRI